MTNQPIPHARTDNDEALLEVAETLVSVANKLSDDINCVATACASHDRALLALVDEIEQMRVANAQLYIRLLQIEKKERNHHG
jgi:hypothetical protein